MRRFVRTVRRCWRRGGLALVAGLVRARLGGRRDRPLGARPSLRGTYVEMAARCATRQHWDQAERHQAVVEACAPFRVPDPAVILTHTQGAWVFRRHGRAPQVQHLWPDTTWARCPQDEEMRLLQTRGYDGFVDNAFHPNQDTDVRPFWIVVVFDPHQLKSAISNRGTFDPTNPNICE